MTTQSISDQLLPGLDHPIFTSLIFAGLASSDVGNRFAAGYFGDSPEELSEEIRKLQKELDGAIANRLPPRIIPEAVAETLAFRLSGYAGVSVPDVVLAGRPTDNEHRWKQLPGGFLGIRITPGAKAASHVTEFESDSSAVLRIHSFRTFLGCTSAGLDKILVDKDSNLLSIDHKLLVTDNSDLRRLVVFVRHSYRLASLFREIGNKIGVPEIRKSLSDIEKPFWNDGAVIRKEADAKAWFENRLRVWRSHFNRDIPTKSTWN